MLQDKKVQRYDSLRNEMLYAKIAALDFREMSTPDIAKELEIPKDKVKRIKESEGYRQFIKDFSDREIMPLLLEGRKGLVKLVALAVKVIEQNLKEGKLEAAKIVLGATGLASPVEAKQDAQLTVILPNATKQELEVKADAVQGRKTKERVSGTDPEELPIIEIT